MPNPENLVTPTYQDIIILSFNTIITRIMDQDIKGAFIGLKTIFRILPPKCQLEVQSDYEEALNQLDQIHKDSNIFNQSAKDNEEKYYLSVQNYSLLDKFKTSLFKNGYLVFESNRPPTRESSMKDLELTVNKAMYGRKE